MPEATSVTRAEIEHAVRKVIIETLLLDDVSPESIDGGKPDFIVALGANSIDALEIILSVEERFGFEFEDHELRPEMLSTLDHFVSEVCKKTGAAGH